MRYATEEGKVVQILRGMAVIRMDCAPSAECASCCACSLFGGRSRTIEVDRSDLSEGDLVQVRLPRASAYWGILLVFVLPVALFALGAIVGGTLARSAGGADSVSLPGGLLGFVAAVVIAWRVNRRLAARFPIVVHKIESPGGSE